MKGDRLIQTSTAAVVIGIGTIAAVVSFRHALEVVRLHGESGATAYLSPLTIDGLVYVASMVLLDSARRGRRAPALAQWALVLGIGATVAVNVLHGVEHGPVGAMIAAWPAVTLVLVVELLMGMIRHGQVQPAAAGPPEVSEAERVATAVARQAEGVPVEQVAVATGERVEQLAIATGAEPDPVVAGLVADARDRFAATIAAGRLPAVRAIRRELRVGHPRAVAVRSALAELST